MCRVLGYLGRPISLDTLLYGTDSSLASQAYGPRMMAPFLNLAGFGLAAWDPRSRHPEEPFLYRVTEVPTFDTNLRSLADKLEPTCLLAHVRGVTWHSDEIVSLQNVHPFRFPGVAVLLAHNGTLRDFASMRYDLVPHMRPELLRWIAGSTDSEWIYALLLSQLEDPYQLPEADELAAATRRTLAVLRDVRRRRGIAVSSPTNLFVTTGKSLVATRFSFDYGWYPPNDLRLEKDLPYVSLWFTLGGDYGEREGEWLMLGDAASSLIVASEPLTADVSTWLEVPEYSLLAATQDGRGVHVETSDLDV